jgi:DNA polymerase-4
MTIPAPRRILHVDMDAFYASVEQRDAPELAGRPVIVGGTPEGRGVVAAASYAARRYGVHSAMPAARARRLCPQGAFLRPRMAHYAEISASIRTLLRRYTPVIEPLALDEAFLDVTASERLFGAASDMAAEIKLRIREELGLPASVGVAGNKFLAKLACTLGKPDGLLVVPDQEVLAFLAPLPVSRLWGVGDTARAALAGQGVRTVADLRAVPAERLRELFGSSGERVRQLAHGIDDRPVVPDGQAKSISHETTFAHDIGDLNVLRAWVVELAQQVGMRARARHLRGRTVRLKLRYADFRTVTRARSLPQPLNDTSTIAATATALLEREHARGGDALRLVGVGLAGFPGNEADSPQPDLFSEAVAQPASALDSVADRISDRFGPAAVARARSLAK